MLGNGLHVLAMSFCIMSVYRVKIHCSIFLSKNWKDITSKKKGTYEELCNCPTLKSNNVSCHLMPRK